MVDLFGEDKLLVKPRKRRTESHRGCRNCRYGPFLGTDLMVDKRDESVGKVPDFVLTFGN
jgi:hypothetical protein